MKTKHKPERTSGQAIFLAAATALIIGVLAGATIDAAYQTNRSAHSPQPATPHPASPLKSDTTTEPPHQRNHLLKSLMLDLINEHRRHHALLPLTQGTNPAPQLHADASLQTCTGSHWSADGLKPYARHSVHGGYHPNAENWSSTGHCPNGTPLRDTPANLARQATKGLIESPSHRANILNPNFTSVSLGVAWNSHQFNAVQHFEAQTAKLENPPSISPEGVLHIEGHTADQPRINSKDQLVLTISHDPPPQTLTPRQTSATYCYQLGPTVARIRPPARPGWTYQSDTWTFTQNRRHCQEPQHQPPVPGLNVEPTKAARLFQKARQLSASTHQAARQVSYITANRWFARNTRFKITADISALTSQHGPGIYTVTLNLNHHNRSIPLVQYSVFHLTTSPQANGQNAPETHTPNSSLTK